MTRLIGATLLLSLMGCKKVDQAPKNIEEMMNFMFVHFDDEDPTELIQLRDNLQNFVGSHINSSEDGWQVNSISKADIEAAGIDTEGKQLKGVVGAAASIPYTSSQADVARSITWPKKTDVLNNLESYKVKEDGASWCGKDGKGTGVLDDFLSKSCDMYFADVHQVAKAGPLGKATQNVTFEHRWIVPEDSDPIYIVRVLSPRPTNFSNPIIGVKQQYSVAMVYVDDCQVYAGAPIVPVTDEETSNCKNVGRRVEAFWVDVELLGSDLPESMAVNLAINQMGDAAEAIDGFVANNFKPVD